MGNVKVIEKENRVVVKMYCRESFVNSAVIPTSYYPLNGQYEVFTQENTEMLKDEKVLALIDGVEYQIGHCYQNSRLIADTLVFNGYEAETYVGWLFVGDAIPIHHCWVKFKDSIIDLSDDFAVLFSKENAMHFQGVKSKEEYAEVLASFHQFVRERHIPNSVRCCPIGKPHSSLVYIGSVCEPEEGRKIYNQLITQYPDHECHKNVGEDGMNATQRQLFQSGLM